MKLKKKVNKPLPLKQRTSSVDARRDYNTQTWYSVLGLLKIREYIITVDHFSIWRRHLAWAMENGKNLRDHMTQRYASSMVFMSLLLSTELNILFNSSMITTKMRHSLQNEEYWLIEFWIGIMIIFSAVLTLLSLISTYTVIARAPAWSMVSCVDPSNAHCIFRSSIGQYVAELPGRFIVGSIYSFLMWVMMFFFVLLPVGYWSIALAVVSFLLFAHTICVLSAFGRIIMHSGAMGHQRVFEQTYEKNLLPHSLHAHLLAKAKANLSQNTSILRQYRSSYRPIDGLYSDDELSDYLQASEEGDSTTRSNGTPPPSKQSSFDGNSSFGDSYYRTPQSFDYPASEPRRRADSIVRFADEVDMVTSSPPKNNLQHRSREPMISVPEADTPVSQLSATSPPGDSPDSAPSRSEEAKSEQNIEPAKEAKPQRPGVVRRDRSNTSATGNEFDALFQKGSPRNAPGKLPLPPTTKPRVQPHAPARAGSESTLNVPRDDWLRTRPPVDTRYHGPPDKRNSTGSLPALSPSTPGLSVLENAAKLQRQWRNSYVERSNSDRGLGGSLPPPSPPSNRPTRPASLMENEASLHQFWVNSSPSTVGSRKDYPEQRQSDITNDAPPASYAEPARASSPDMPPPSSMSHVSSADVLSSKGSTSGGMSLSEEEEEAYRRDYGSDDDDLWEPQATEAASLLNNDRLDRGTQSYMSVDNSAPRQGSNGNQQYMP